MPNTMKGHDPLHLPRPIPLPGPTNQQLHDPLPLPIIPTNLLCFTFLSHTLAFLGSMYAKGNCLQYPCSLFKEQHDSAKRLNI